MLLLLFGLVPDEGEHGAEGWKNPWRHGLGENQRTRRTMGISLWIKRASSLIQELKTKDS